VQTNYLQHVFEPDLFQRSVNKTVTTAERIRKDTGYDTIVFSGMSGAAMAFMLAHWMNMPLLCVRKRNDSSHFVSQTRKYLEGNAHDVRKYLIVDDFISSGATVQYIMDTIRETNVSAECVSLLMYAGYSNREWIHPVTRKMYQVTTSNPDANE
jgi:adenine/guanine phosphoribosyltransferase-like PRPP-binding protein